MATQIVAAGVKIALSIEAPASANVGDVIVADAHLKNLTADYLYIAPTGVYNSTTLLFQFDYLLVAPGETVVFRAVFNMPNKSINITVWSWWWDGSQWVMDDVGSVSISLGVAAGWTRLANPLTANLDVPTWTKLSSPLMANLDVAAIPAGWVKLGAPISGQLTPGFELPPDYELVMSTIYPDGKTYNGPAERVVATFEFLPADFPGAKWFLDKTIVESVAQKIKDAGLKPLTMKLYESGFRYILEIEAGKPAASSVPLAPVAWSAIIIGALVLAALIVLFFTIKTVTDFIYKAPGAATASGLIFLGIAGVALLGLAMSKGTSIKGAITGK